MQVLFDIVALGDQWWERSWHIGLVQVGHMDIGALDPLHVCQDVLDVVRELILLLLLISELCWLRLVGISLSPSSLGGHATSDG